MSPSIWYLIQSYSSPSIFVLLDNTHLPFTLSFFSCSNILPSHLFFGSWNAGVSSMDRWSVQSIATCLCVRVSLRSSRIRRKLPVQWVSSPSKVVSAHCGRGLNLVAGGPQTQRLGPFSSPQWLHFARSSAMSSLVGHATRFQYFVPKLRYSHHVFHFLASLVLGEEEGKRRLMFNDPFFAPSGVEQSNCQGLGLQDLEPVYTVISF